MIKKIKSRSTLVKLDVALDLTHLLKAIWPACLVVLLMLILLFGAVIIAGKVLYPNPMPGWLFNLSWLLILSLALIFTALLGLVTYHYYR